LEADFLTQLRIEPAFEKAREHPMFSVAFDKQNKLHAIASNSLDVNSAPSE
jgi:hypothetical protein